MAIVFVIPEEFGHRKLCIIMNEDMCNVSEKTIIHLMIFFKLRLNPFSECLHKRTKVRSY